METTNTEKREVLLMLQEGADALEVALKDIDDHAAQRKPSPESWSVLECIEHLTLTETGLLSRLRDAKPGEESHEDRARERKFRDLALDRARRIEAPPQVVPPGESNTVAHALDNFTKARCETVRFVEEFRGQLHMWLTLHPLITRPVNCYEMLLLMAMHPHRHAMQIAQIRQWLRDGKGSTVTPSSSPLE